MPISRFCFVNFCKQQQRNEQEIITHAYTATALVAVEFCLINSLKPNKLQNNEQPNERKNKRNARLRKKAAESAENISGTKRNQNIYNDVPAIFSQVVRESRFGCPPIAPLISSENLGTMSKNKLRRIALVRGPMWGIQSLTLIISWEELSDEAERSCPS